MWVHINLDDWLGRWSEILSQQFSAGTSRIDDSDKDDTMVVAYVLDSALFGGPRQHVGIGIRINLNKPVRMGFGQSVSAPHVTGLIAGVCPLTQCAAGE